MGNAIGRAIDRYTFSPDLDKALREEHAAARDKLRALQELSGRIRAQMSEQDKASVTKTRLLALSDEVNAWIQKNGKSASSEEIENKTLQTKDSQKSILEKNAGNYFYEVVLVLSDQLAASLPLDKRAGFSALLGKERAWFKTNQDLTLDSYKQRKTEFDKQVAALKIDPVRVNENTRINIESVKTTTATLPSEEESLGFFGYFLYSILISFLVFFCCAGGSFAANMSIDRPIAYRVLSFVYGFLFAIFLVAYAAIRALSGKGIKMYALFIPLFETDIHSPNLRWFTYVKPDAS